MGKHQQGEVLHAALHPQPRVRDQQAGAPHALRRARARRAVRMPNKSDGTGHRGFAFVEFLSRADAMTAFDALSGTHPYGRRLVLEPAGPEDSSVEGALKRARQREEREATGVKRRKLAMNHGAEGAFDEV